MHSLSPLITRVLSDDLQRKSRVRARAASVRRPAVSQPHEITLRPAHADDAAAVIRLAALDSRSAPAEPVLLAEADGKLRAAVSLSDGNLVADPFYATRTLESLLRARAGQLRAA